MKANGKVLIVTGAGSGIGRELVLHLLEKGATVAAFDINDEALKETALLCREYSTLFSASVVDITDRTAVENAIEGVVDRFGVVDGVINNAGIIQSFVRLADLPYDTIDRMFAVNFFGTLHVTKAVLPHLLKRPQGHIVNVSSMGGFIAVPGQTIYGAAKAAVKLMTEGLAGELMGTNVRATVVFPGAVATNIMANSGVSRKASTEPGSNRIKPLAPKEAARLIVSGMERDAFQVMIGKDAKMIDRLYRLKPAFAARMIAKKMGSLLAP